jgi:hypothetical protein
MNIRGIIIAIAVLAIGTIAITYLSFENTNMICIYGVSGGLLKGSNSCPISGTPNILSQVRNQMGGDFNYILENDKHQYRLIVFGGIECYPSCSDVNIQEACHYDRNGEFIPLLSDAQKSAILDLNNSFSIPICPLMGKTNISNYTSNMSHSVPVNVMQPPSIAIKSNTSNFAHSTTPVNDRVIAGYQNFRIGASHYLVQYVINGGDVISINTSAQRHSLLINLKTHSDGLITITLSRDLIDAKISSPDPNVKLGDLQDDKFTVIINGQPVSKFNETKNRDVRIPSIPFHSGDTTIIIVGTYFA